MVEEDIPMKYQKLVKSGRWEYITKHDGKGEKHIVGIRRKSTGAEMFFNVFVVEE
jgi:hypothetical protein